MSAAAPVPVILNPSSGTGHGAPQAERLQALFHDAGLAARIISPADGAQLFEAAQREARARPPLIVAGGGDGTVSAVAGALAGSGIALGVLPLGTLNHFARDVGVSLDIAQAVRDIAAGRTREVDVGEVNGRVFINNSSLGLYPHVVRERDRRRRLLGVGKWRAMLWASMKVLRRYPFVDVSLNLGGQQKALRTPFVFVGNNEYEMQGSDLGTRKRLDCGLLSIYLAPTTGRLGLLGLALRGLFGRLAKGRDFEMTQVAAAQIRPHRRKHKKKHMLVSTDGEVSSMETPIEYRVRPKALRVIVPAASASAGAA
jgi:diacylglycerol kinase family enzyme